MKAHEHLLFQRTSIRAVPQSTCPFKDRARRHLLSPRRRRPVAGDTGLRKMPFEGGGAGIKQLWNRSIPRNSTLLHRRFRSQKEWDPSSGRIPFLSINLRRAIEARFTSPPPRLQPAPPISRPCPLLPT